MLAERLSSIRKDLRINFLTSTWKECGTELREKLASRQRLCSARVRHHGYAPVESSRLQWRYSLNEMLLCRSWTHSWVGRKSASRGVSLQRLGVVGQKQLEPPLADLPKPVTQQAGWQEGDLQPL